MSISNYSEVAIYDDNGSGQPAPVGSPLEAFTQTPISTLSSGNVFGHPAYDYADVLASPLSLAAGTYYIAINEVSGLNDTSTTNGNFFVADNGGAWDERTATLAFELQGINVPEPASIALMGGALGMLAFVRRRNARSNPSRDPAVRNRMQRPPVSTPPARRRKIRLTRGA